MNDRGQVFTLDMLVALILVALMVSCSGKAFDIAVNRPGSYLARYSLERTANDAADVLVKTTGRPSIWGLGNLETLGLAENVVDDLNMPLLNTIDSTKFALLRHLCSAENWSDPANKNARYAVENLFGGSNFELRVLDKDENLLWDIWPGWAPEKTSGSENALEVTVVRRSIAMRYGEVRAEIRALKHSSKPEDYYLNFYVYPGELDSLDWYIILEPSGATQPVTKIWVNRTTGNQDYQFPSGGKTFIPRYHGGDDDIENTLTENDNAGNPNNYLKIRVTGSPPQFVDVYVVAVPRCSPLRAAQLAPHKLPATLEVKLWR
jgi:hypothetical protein